MAKRKKPVTSMPGHWGKRQIIERLQQMCVVVLDLMPEVTVCPNCHGQHALKTPFTLDTDDVFVIYYACVECTFLSVLQILKDRGAMIEMAMPTRRQLEITIVQYDGKADVSYFVEMLAEQLDITPPAKPQDKAGLN